MNLNSLTEEQRQSLGYEKSTAFYERTDTTIDTATGEIIKQNSEIIKKVASEPDFVKLYYKTMLAFNGADDIPLSFVLAISSQLSWSNDGKPQVFRNDSLVRDRIKEMCNIKDSMYQKYLTRCKEKGLLFSIPNYRGYYEVNPFFIAKGQWSSIKKLRANFDFVNGKWQRQSEITKSLEEPSEEPSEESIKKEA